MFMEEIIVYQAPASRKKKPQWLKWASRFLLVAGLVVSLLLLSPFIFLEAGWRLGWLGNREASIPTGPEGESGFARVIRESDIKILQPTNTEFSVVIPEIGVNAAVAANISISNEAEYRSALKKGVAHAAGSYFPGENGTIFIFGHSTDYIWNVARFNAVLYLMKELEIDDQVNVFYQGQRHVYQVVERRVIEPNDEDFLQAKAGEEKLILATCWPPATTLKRLVVSAQKV